ncbi:DUF3667 domain-containing protein [Opitutus terrae]|uniref:DUF3667 domain-containing protein n=1 Tax=Opitutus terrae TaxID=107709 RepID=UPI002351C6DB|nr:DUF3667 domain-containing protein [Opitutus terrae]
MFHFEGKFFVTVAWLLAHPGRLTREFLAGRRQRQVNPLRLYLFVSVLFFVGAAVLNHGHLLHYNRDVLDSLQTEVARELKSPASRGTVTAERVEQLEQKVGQVRTDPAALAEAVRAMANLAEPVAESAGTPATTSSAGAAPVHAHVQLSGVESGLGKRLADKLAGGRLTLGQIWDAIEHRIPTLVFLGVPLYAAWLKVLFLGRRRNYIEHLVFSLHLHAWTFLVGMVAFGYANIFSLGPDWMESIFEWALFGWMLGYVLLSFRRVYELSWWSAAGSVALLTFLHGLALFFLGLVLMVATVAWLAWT